MYNERKTYEIMSLLVATVGCNCNKRVANIIRYTSYHDVFMFQSRRVYEWRKKLTKTFLVQRFWMLKLLSPVVSGWQYFKRLGASLFSNLIFDVKIHLRFCNFIFSSVKLVNVAAYGINRRVQCIVNLGFIFGDAIFIYIWNNIPFLLQIS